MAQTHRANTLKSVLVVGGGIAGMAAAIRLREMGAAVEIVDRDQGWSVYGTGITLSPLTFRALCHLGLKDELRARAHCHDGVTINDAQGNLIREIRSERLVAANVPAEGAVLRPVLQDIMAVRVRELETTVRLGLSVEALIQDASGVDVTFTDGSNGRFDLVVGADGLQSHLRSLVLQGAPEPKHTGQSSWRVVFDTPDDWYQGQIFLGTDLKVGFNPCSPSQMYMYLLEPTPGNPRREPDQMPSILRGLLAPFGGVVAKLRDTIIEPGQIVYRPLESVFVDGDWYRGRVVLIGDAVHTTTPHLGSGAGLAVEDALVLVDELERADNVETALRAFMRRRLGRARLVLGTSIRIGRMELAGDPAAEQAELMAESVAAMAEPY